MKKILILTNHSFMLYQFRRELVARLLQDMQVVISVPFGDHVQDFEQMGCRMIDTAVDRRGINPATDLKLYFVYRKHLKAERPDMVITYSIKPNIYGGYACRRLNIPYCVNVQGLGTAFQKKGLAQMVHLMYKTALRGAKTVFFENTGNAALFAKNKIVSLDQQTILNGAGVNLDHYAYAPYSEQNGIHFLFVGRIMKEKGVDEFFYAAKKIKQIYQDQVIFDVVGFFEDKYREVVQQLEQDGVIVFHGFQQEVRPYYAQANCIVLPSYHEGMSNVLLEAAATGRALITSDIPGCREAVEDGKSGYLCRAADAEALACAMEQFIVQTQEQREAMGFAGMQRMQRLFDKKDVVQTTVAAIIGRR